MRLSLLAFSVATLAAASGCSNGTPVTPDSAWTVNLAFASGCMISDNTTTVGDVTVSSIQTRVDDGVNAASVSCSVTGTGPFEVNATATLGADTLDILIPAISSSASMASPATGSVSYESAATVANYEATGCNFWFANGKEGVAAGQVWVAFSCDTIANASAGSTCTLPANNPSVALFENCATM